MRFMSRIFRIKRCNKKRKVHKSIIVIRGMDGNFNDINASEALELQKGDQIFLFKYPKNVRGLLRFLLDFLIFRLD